MTDTQTPHCHDQCGHDHGHDRVHDHDHDHSAAAASCGDGCGHDHNYTDATPRLRRALWIALALNAAMFFVEMGGGVGSHSSSLLADAVDFGGDAANYALGLAALSMGLLWRSRTAWLKGGTMAVYGVAVLALTLWRVVHGSVPEPATMGVIGFMALAVNVGVAVLLYAFRDGDAQMRSVWLCTRNDAIGNVLVMLAAAGVFGTGRAWPDLAVAAIMSLMALQAGVRVLAHARQELQALAVR